MRITFTFLLTFLLGGAFNTLWGQGVGGTSPTETTHITRQLSHIPEEDIQVAQIGLPEARIGVELDVNGLSWLKHIDADETAFSAFSQHDVFLQEHLVISGQQRWTGWTQQIDAPGFAWRSDSFLPSLVPGVLVNGLSPAGLNIQIDGGTLRFSFDPLPPGTQIDVTSRLLYTGTFLPDSFDVRQFPTPEPATVALLAMAGMTLLGRRRIRIV